MMSDILSYLTVWQRDLKEHLPQVTASQRAALARAGALLEQVGAPLPAPGGDDGQQLLPDIIGPAQDYAQLQGELDQTIETLTTLSDGKSARLSAEAIRDVLAQSVGSELELLDRELGLVDDEREAGAEFMPGIEEMLTEDRLTDFARGEFPGDPGATIIDLARLPGGYSKDSYSFGLKASTGRCRRLVLRRDLPFGPGANGVVYEFELHRRLYDLGFPVAEPVYAETDATALGQPFILTSLVEGETGTAGWDESREVRHEICYALARVLGRLHNLTADQMAGLAEAQGATPQDHIRAHIGQWHDRWLRRRLHPSPTLTAAFHWLMENVPEDVERLSLLHGDVNFENMIVRGGNIQALTGWEFAHLGDPIEELEQCRQHVEPLASWTMFLEEYRTAGGPEYSEDNARFYAVWRGVRNAVSCSVAWYGFLSGQYPTLKMAYQGVPLYHRYVRDTAKQLQRELL